MLDPEGMARRWVPGSGAAVVRLLARGPGHATYRVRRDGRSYAMRLPLRPLAPLVLPTPGAGAVACAALDIHAAAAAAGLAPVMAGGDPDTGILVTEWMRGRVWTRACARDPARAARIAALVGRIQSLRPGPHCRVQGPADWIRHYGARLARDGAAPRSGAAALADEAAHRLAAFARLAPREPLLCHSDLHRLNLLDGPAGLIALDWEYAHYSDPYWDLAGWLSANDLGGPYGAALLRGYLGRAPHGTEMRRLTALTWLYDYVCLLWSDACRRDLAEPAGAALARRAHRLAARLMRAVRA